MEYAMDGLLDRFTSCASISSTSFSDEIQFAPFYTFDAANPFDLDCKYDGGATMSSRCGRADGSGSGRRLCCCSE